MGTARISWVAANDESLIVNYVVDSTADMTPTPPEESFTQQALVPPNGAPDYNAQFVHANGNHVFRVRSIDADGEYGVTELKVVHNVQPILPDSPNQPITAINV